MISMIVTQINGKWWILDPASPDPIGPYQTREAATIDAARSAVSRDAFLAVYGAREPSNAT